MTAETRAVPVELTVWYGSMPESNGKTNWTAILHRKGGCLSEGITIDQSEHPERTRYEADSMRYLIGEIEEEPDILAYDADKHSGYVEPAAPVTTQEPVEWRYRYTHRGELSKWFPVESYLKLYNIANDPAYEIQPLYTHANASEVERLRADVRSLHEAGEFLDAVAQGVEDKLRAQLAERDALLSAIASWTTETRDAVLESFQDELNESASYEWYDNAIADLMRLVTALSASAEPSAPVEHPQLVGEDELQDLAASACQMALSHGVSEDWFLRLARTVEQRARAKLNGGAQ